MEISAAELDAQMMGKVLVDIRRTEEWRSIGVIAESYLLTFFDAAGNADPAAWLADLEKVATPEDDLVLICHSDYRTRIILKYLQSQTLYKNARYLAGGIRNWLDNGLPVHDVA